MCLTVELHVISAQRDTPPVCSKIDDSNGYWQRQERLAEEEITHHKNEYRASGFGVRSTDDLPHIKATDVLSVLDVDMNRVRIGSGAAGSCYLCKMVTSEDYCVVKFAHPGIDADDFNREMMMAWVLSESGATPKFLGILSDDAHIYKAFVSEHIGIPGESVTLEQFAMANNSSLTETDWIRYCHAISKKLAIMHRMGIVHGDIKADNIIVTGGTNKDVDFFFTDLGQATLSESSYGYSINEDFRRYLRNVHPYIAPELTRGSEFSKSSDIFFPGVYAAPHWGKHLQQKAAEDCQNLYGTCSF